MDKLMQLMKFNHGAIIIKWDAHDMKFIAWCETNSALHDIDGSGDTPLQAARHFWQQVPEKHKRGFVPYNPPYNPHFDECPMCGCQMTKEPGIISNRDGNFERWYCESPICLYWDYRPVENEGDNNESPTTD